MTMDNNGRIPLMQAMEELAMAVREYTDKKTGNGGTVPGEIPANLEQRLKDLETAMKNAVTAVEVDDPITLEIPTWQDFSGLVTEINRYLHDVGMTVATLAARVDALDGGDTPDVPPFVPPEDVDIPPTFDELVVESDKSTIKDVINYFKSKIPDGVEIAAFVRADDRTTHRNAIYCVVGRNSVYNESNKAGVGFYSEAAVGQTYHVMYGTSTEIHINVGDRFTIIPITIKENGGETA